MEKLTTFVTKPSDPSTYQQSLALAGFSTHFSAAGRNVTFSGAGSDPGADAVMFTWSFGDGASATSSHTGPGTFSDTQTHSFPAAGSYTVQLTVSDDDGGAGHDQITVIVP
jgi:PKD repeat protein